MKYKTAKILIFILTIAVMALPVCLEMIDKGWMIPEKYEMLAYAFMTVSSFIICFEIEKQISNSKYRTGLIVANSVLLTCVTIIYNNILMYLENYQLYTDVMEWSYLDIVMKNIGYNGYRYVLCLLMIFVVQIMISKTDKLKKLLF